MSKVYELDDAQMEIERTRNYIKFQIYQTEEALNGFSDSAPKICYAHLIELRKNLLSELHELNRNTNRKHFA